MSTPREVLLASIKQAVREGRGYRLNAFELRILWQDIRPRPWFLRLFDVPANWWARRRYRVHP